MGSSEITENNDFLQIKKNFKWFESRIENFNTAVTYQTNALQKHKHEIINLYRLENFTAVKQVRVSAECTIRNLKQLLVDIHKLRNQVKESDLDKFDKSVAPSRQNILSVLKSFDDYYKSLSFGTKCDNFENKTSDVTELENYNNFRQKQILLGIAEDTWEFENQKEIAISVQKIENEVQAANEMFTNLAMIVNNQRESVTKLEDEVEKSHIHVANAEKELAQAAAKIHGTTYPLVGALIGSCFGGPVGFLAGLKLGTIVALAGSLIGFSSGQVLKTKHQRIQKEIISNIKESPTIKS